MFQKTLILIVFPLLVMYSDSPKPIAQQQQEWQLVFSDEFDGKNGSQPDATKWSQPQRGTSIWSRWIKNTPKTVFIKNGVLVCRAIPNKMEKADTARMLTGAIYTKDKFEFQYGKVEVRMKTNLRRGNFPAAWMGRKAKKASDPYAEIDIVEMFGDRKQAHQNIHSQLTFTKTKHNEKNSFHQNIDITKWHIYGVEWSAKEVLWTIDGMTVAVYRKSNNKNRLSQGQWSFDQSLYLLLNQSVGNGVYGYFAPNVRKTYETQFDWIRVYQKR